MAENLQLRKNKVEEMGIVLENYTIILKKADMLYPDYGTAYAKQLLYTIFKMYMPLIEAELERFRSLLHRAIFEKVDTNIEYLKTKYGNRDAGQWTEQDFISPIVLLLKLANDKGHISFDQEQNDWVREKVTSFMSNSNDFKRLLSETVLQKGYIEEDEIADFKQKSKLMRTHLPGIVASWSPPGTYKPACLLDYCRFHMLRPPKAEELEQNGWWKITVKDEAGRVTRKKRVTDKKVWDTDSCAEWAAFLELAKVSTATVTEASQW
ncbi:hypothetical protein OEA41_002690 [Lepraria neglecta]|uniref:Uncharacterized protein n=1 Tax=Lepraria neglecta TaxID=209136 RepID=A0AAD9Z2X4_9LECA|nr:hypothetical protein OEA41_002690 [Lepraria neglecta]